MLTSRAGWATRRCEVIAEAGVLVCEPGTYSYGLGSSSLRAAESRRRRLVYFV